MFYLSSRFKQINLRNLPLGSIFILLKNTCDVGCDVNDFSLCLVKLFIYIYLQTEPLTVQKKKKKRIWKGSHLKSNGFYLFFLAGTNESRVLHFYVCFETLPDISAVFGVG